MTAPVHKIQALRTKDGYSLAARSIIFTEKACQISNDLATLWIPKSQILSRDGNYVFVRRWFVDMHSSRFSIIDPLGLEKLEQEQKARCDYSSHRISYFFDYDGDGIR